MSDPLFVVPCRRICIRISFQLVQMKGIGQTVCKPSARMNGAVCEQALMAGVERQTVDECIERCLMIRIYFSMEPKRAEYRLRQPCLSLQPLDQISSRRVTLCHSYVPE